MNAPPNLNPGGPQGGDDNTKNMLIAMVLMMAILFAWEFFFNRPRLAEIQKERAAQAELQKQQQAPQAGAGGASGEAIAPAAPRDRGAVVASAPRLVFDTPSLDGTINLEGARFDDLSLKQYRQRVERDSPEVTLLTPQGAPHHLDAFFGWEDAATGTTSVGAGARWTAPEGARLTPTTPVTLTHETEDGLRYTRTISVDERYVFTIADTVTNTGAAARTLRPFGSVRRTGYPDDFVPNQIVHQGMVGVFGERMLLKEARYQKALTHANDKAEGKKQGDTRIEQADSKGGWLGFSDHYWLTALLPAQSETITAWYDSNPAAQGVTDRRKDAASVNFRAAYRGSPRDIAPGASATYTQHFYAGAKRVDQLRKYQAELQLPDFDKAVDWGNFWFLTRPFFAMLEYFGKLLGNFGLAIMATTVVIKILMFPLVYQSYKTFSKMKKVQPKMKEIQERYAADKQRQQQEMIKLYQTEKLNPVAGCIPILFQIPIFYALYKVLTVTIEMRHAPFFGWIQDLSAKDPTSWANLFGIIPFDPGFLTSIPILGAVFAVGIWPILYGVTMWALYSLQPPAGDPVQVAVFKFLPILFVFLFAGFAAGLVIYWTWSNLLSIIQQYVIMRRDGVETEFDKWIAKITGKAPAAAK
jgi:YidC/Oxa1 family membrane protein insertase